MSRGGYRRYNRYSRQSPSNSIGISTRPEVTDKAYIRSISNILSRHETCDVSGIGQAAGRSILIVKMMEEKELVVIKKLEVFSLNRAGGYGYGPVRKGRIVIQVGRGDKIEVKEVKEKEVKEEKPKE